MTGYTLGEVGKMTRVRPATIDYHLTLGCLPEPEKVGRIRVFTDEDVARIREYFAGRKKWGRTTAATNY